MKSKIFFRLLVVLALFAISCIPAAAQEPGEFADVGIHWAAENIAQCRAYQLMNGYPGNLFMPDQNLSRAEALVVIARSLGWDRQADGMSTGGIKFPEDLWSGFRGYVALAANRELIARNDIPRIRFNDPAPRIEMAVWLAKALNLTGNGASLNFSDLSEIPSAQRNILAGVVEAGILKGLPGNLFGPSKPLTRAEMAAILARLIDGGKITPPYGRHVTGILKMVSREQQKISIESPYGTNTYDLDGSYTVYRNGGKSYPNDLVVGENVKISLNQYGRCVIIAYGDSSSLGQKTITYTGTAVSLNNGFLIFRPDTGSTLGLTVSPSAVITVSGVSVSPASVAAGSRGVITVTGGRITRIDLTGSNIPSPSGDRGYVVNKYIDYFTVRSGYGSVREIWTAGVFFTRNGAGSTYGALKRGSYVELVRTGSEVTAVNILDGDRRVFGEVEGYNRQSITIRDDDGDSNTYYLADGVTVREGISTRRLDDVKEGMGVRLTLDDGNRVTRVDILSKSSVEGRVTYIRYSGTPKIRIEKTSGTEATYYLAGSYTVRDGGRTRHLDDVLEGMKVRLTLNSSGDVTRIDVLDSYSSSDAEGEVTHIQTTGSNKMIEIIDSSGTERTYILANSVSVWEGGSARSLNYIVVGMRVNLALNSSNDVFRIDIGGTSDLSAVEGEVTYIRTSGTKRIDIKKSNGNERGYYINDGVSVREGNHVRDLYYIRTGMDVELTIDANSWVTRIFIL